jgi:LysR family transcriptional activator of nhaA
MIFHYHQVFTDLGVAVAGLNFKHLRYFWTVAKSGSIARASALLHVTAQSISSQLAELEESLGAPLLRRSGRGLEVTDFGRLVAAYAERVFSVEAELLDVVRDRGQDPALPFRLGIADSVPKTLTYRVIEPALSTGQAIRLICREGRLAALLADLAIHRLDVVIADRPMPANLNVRAYNHLLGQSELVVFAQRARAGALAAGFPGSLEGVPFLLPGEDVAIRPALEQWFAAHNVRPRIVGEFDDSALIKAFGEGGAGLFAAPLAIAENVRRHYDVDVVGRIEGVSEQLYAITTERQLRHPAMVAIRAAAESVVFRVDDAPGTATRRRAARPRAGSVKRAG